MTDNSPPSIQVSRFTTTQKWTLLATILASSLVFIDSTALNIALPALQADLGISGTQLLWVINGYALFLSALLLVGGSLGDLYGRNKIFLVGLGLFSLASLVCGISQTPLQLIVARSFQGIGAALLTPGSLSILSSQFGPESRGRAIGLWSTFSALTAVFGPILGGWLAGMGWWRVIFIINIPLSLVVLVTMLAKVPESSNPDAQNLDMWGALWVTLGLAGITYGFIESPNHGLGNPVILTSLIIGTVALMAFIRAEYTSTHPMMPLKLFRSSTFSGGNLLTLFVYGALGGALFFLPLNLIQVQNYSELYAGLAMLPMITFIASISPLMGKYVDKRGVRFPLIIGPLIVSAGFFLFSTYGITEGPADYWQTFFVSFCLLGIGMGITVAPLTAAVMGAVSPNNAGIASGVNNTVARAAGVLAVALLGALVLFYFNNSIEKKLGAMQISESMKSEIRLEASKLAGAKAPTSLAKDQQVIIDKLFKTSFILAFNRVAYTAALMTLLGGLMAMVFIHSKPNNKAVETLE